MAIKLLRESSETPNISNKDDVKMVRYAYGGYNGIVQKYGEQLAASSDGTSFRIGSGRAVVDGWEVDIDGAGVTLDLSHMSYGSYYYTVYLEVNAELETAEIKYLYDTGSYPVIDHGDDLTEVQSGTARLPLYEFLSSYGSITEVKPVVSTVPYSSDQISKLNKELNDTIRIEIDSVKERLNALGFKEGVALISGASSVSRNSLKKQGKYVLFNLSATVQGSSYMPSISFTIPEGFRPKEQTTLAAVVGGAPSNPQWVYISTDGKCTTSPDYTITGGILHIRNAGWETA